MTRTMKRAITICLILCLALTLVPAAFAAEKQGWQEENGGWRYYENGAPLTGVCWIEAEQNRYLFDADGLLQTGDADGDVLMNGNLYYINPAKNVSDPKTCYAVRNYTRSRTAGVTYYDGDGITFVGWMNTADGGRMYQTLIRKEDIGAAKDLYIYVWRGQHLPAGIDPVTGETIPAGWYLFGEDGVLVQEFGWHDSGDGKAYRTDGQGRILEEAPLGTTKSPAPATKDIAAMIEAAHAYAHSKRLGINPNLAIGCAGFENPINTSILSPKSIQADLYYCIDRIVKMLDGLDNNFAPIYNIVMVGDRIYVLYG